MLFEFAVPTTSMSQPTTTVTGNNSNIMSPLPKDDIEFSLLFCLYSAILFQYKCTGLPRGSEEYKTTSKIIITVFTTNIK